VTTRGAHFGDLFVAQGPLLNRSRMRAAHPLRVSFRPLYKLPAFTLPRRAERRRPAVYPNARGADAAR